MPDDRTTPSYVPAETPAIGGALHREPQGARNLCVALGPSIDRIRQIATDLGVRPYRVWLVHIKWPGKKGLGFPQVISKREILPTPRVRDMASTGLSLSAYGLTEVGGLTVDQISAKYSEDDLRGRTPDMVDTVDPRTNDSHVEFYYEVQESRPTTPPPQPRRYVVNGVPSLNRNGMHWIVSLTKQDYNSGRGTP